LAEQVASYAVFPNEGVRVAPRLIRKVSNADGITLWESAPSVTQVLQPETAHTMMTLLQAVTQHGTGAAAAQMNHPLGGKTGTTSDFTDAWFLGFSPSVTCGVWVGYDSRQSLGEKETGARAALPIWMSFMKAAVAGKDDERFPGQESIQPMDRASELETAGPLGAARLESAAVGRKSQTNAPVPESKSAPRPKAAQSPASLKLPAPVAGWPAQQTPARPLEQARPAMPSNR